MTCNADQEATSPTLHFSFLSSDDFHEVRGSCVQNQSADLPRRNKPEVATLFTIEPSSPLQQAGNSGNLLLPALHSGNFVDGLSGDEDDCAERMGSSMDAELGKRVRKLEMMMSDLKEKHSIELENLQQEHERDLDEMQIQIADETIQEVTSKVRRLQANMAEAASHVGLSVTWSRPSESSGLEEDFDAMEVVMSWLSEKLQQKSQDMIQLTKSHWEEVQRRRAVQAELSDLKGPVKVLCNVYNPPASDMTAEAGAEEYNSDPEEVLYNSKCCQLTVNGQQYNFGAVFDPSLREQDCFLSLDPTVLSILEGRSACIVSQELSDGAHSIFKSAAGAGATDSGLVAYCIQTLYDAADADPSLGTLKLQLSAVQVSESGAFDLLASQSINSNTSRNMWVQARLGDASPELANVSVSSWQEALLTLHDCFTHPPFRQLDLKPDSDSLDTGFPSLIGHTLVRVTVSRTCQDVETVSELWLVDVHHSVPLASSGFLPETMKNEQYSPCSVSALASCIEQRCQGRADAPFSDSPLSFTLKGCFNTGCQIAVLVHVPKETSCISQRAAPALAWASHAHTLSRRPAFTGGATDTSLHLGGKACVRQTNCTVASPRNISSVGISPRTIPSLPTIPENAPDVTDYSAEISADLSVDHAAPVSAGVSSVALESSASVARVCDWDPGDALQPMEPLSLVPLLLPQHTAPRTSEHAQDRSCADEDDSALIARLEHTINCLVGENTKLRKMVRGMDSQPGRPAEDARKIHGFRGCAGESDVHSSSSDGVAEIAPDTCTISSNTPSHHTEAHGCLQGRLQESKDDSTQWERMRLPSNETTLTIDLPYASKQPLPCASPDLRSAQGSTMDGAIDPDPLKSHSSSLPQPQCSTTMSAVSSKYDSDLLAVLSEAGGTPLASVTGGRGPFERMATGADGVRSSTATLPHVFESLELAAFLEPGPSNVSERFGEALSIDSHRGRSYVTSASTVVSDSSKIRAVHSSSLDNGIGGVDPHNSFTGSKAGSERHSVAPVRDSVELMAYMNAEESDMEIPARVSSCVLECIIEEPGTGAANDTSSELCEGAAADGGPSATCFPCRNYGTVQSCPDPGYYYNPDATLGSTDACWKTYSNGMEAVDGEDARGSEDRDVRIGAVPHDPMTPQRAEDRLCKEAGRISALGHVSQITPQLGMGGYAREAVDPRSSCPLTEELLDDAEDSDCSPNSGYRGPEEAAARGRELKSWCSGLESTENWGGIEKLREDSEVDPPSDERDTSRSRRSSRLSLGFGKSGGFRNLFRKNSAAESSVSPLDVEKTPRDVAPISAVDPSRFQTPTSTAGRQSIDKLVRSAFKKSAALLTSARRNARRLAHNGGATTPGGVDSSPAESMDRSQTQPVPRLTGALFDLSETGRTDAPHACQYDANPPETSANTSPILGSEYEASGSFVGQSRKLTSSAASSFNRLRASLGMGLRKSGSHRDAGDYDADISSCMSNSSVKKAALRSLEGDWGPGSVTTDVSGNALDSDDNVLFGTDSLPAGIDIWTGCSNAGSVGQDESDVTAGGGVKHSVPRLDSMPIRHAKSAMDEVRSSHSLMAIVRSKSAAAGGEKCGVGVNEATRSARGGAFGKLGKKKDSGVHDAQLKAKSFGSLYSSGGSSGGGKDSVERAPVGAARSSSSVEDIVAARREVLSASRERVRNITNKDPSPHPASRIGSGLRSALSGASSTPFTPTRGVGKPRVVEASYNAAKRTVASFTKHKAAGKGRR